MTNVPAFRNCCCLPFLFLLLSFLPSSSHHPASILFPSCTPLLMVFIEWLRMHRLLSSAGLWPTLVSVWALFVHPLPFHLVSLHRPSPFEVGTLQGLCRNHSSPVVPVYFEPHCVFSLSATFSSHLVLTHPRLYTSMAPHRTCQHVFVVFLASETCSPPSPGSCCQFWDY